MSRQAQDWVASNLPLIRGGTFTDASGRERGIGGDGLALVVYLADVVNKQGTVYASVETYAEGAGASTPATKRLLRAFQDMGWLTQVGTRSYLGRGRPVPEYVLSLVPGLLDAYRAAQAADTGPIGIPLGIHDGIHVDTDNRENVNKTGPSGHGACLEPEPEPHAATATGDTQGLAPVVRMSQGGQEWGSIHDLVLSGCLDALPMEGAKNPTAWRAHHRKKLRGEIIPHVVGNTRNPGPDQVPDLVTRCLAVAFPERSQLEPARVSQSIPTDPALGQVASMARDRDRFTDDRIREYVAEQSPASRAALVVEVRRHRPAFTLGDEPTDPAPELRDTDTLARQVANARRLPR